MTIHPTIKGRKVALKVVRTTSGWRFKLPGDHLDITDKLAPADRLRCEQMAERRAHNG